MEATNWWASSWGAAGFGRKVWIWSILFSFGLGFRWLGGLDGAAGRVGGGVGEVECVTLSLGGGALLLEGGSWLLEEGAWPLEGGAGPSKCDTLSIGGRVWLSENRALLLEWCAGPSETCA